MAQTIYNVVESRNLEVVDGKQTFSVNLPDWFPVSFEDACLNKLIEKFGIEGVLAKALAQIVIDLRAEARKGNDPKVKESPQELVNNYKVKAPRRAKTKLELLQELIGELTPEQVAELLDGSNTEED